MLPGESVSVRNAWMCRFNPRATAFLNFLDSHGGPLPYPERSVPVRRGEAWGPGVWGHRRTVFAPFCADIDVVVGLRDCPGRCVAISGVLTGAACAPAQNGLSPAWVLGSRSVRGSMRSPALVPRSLPPPQVGPTAFSGGTSLSHTTCSDSASSRLPPAVSTVGTGGAPSRTVTLPTNPHFLNAIARNGVRRRASCDHRGEPAAGPHKNCTHELDPRD